MRPRHSLSTLLPSLVVAFVSMALLTACGAGGNTPEDVQTANEVLALVNEVRSDGTTCGGEAQPPVQRLSLDGRLLRAAKLHSLDMEAHGTLTHTGSDGSNPGQRIARVGYEAATWGENAAAGYGSPESVMGGWLNSPGHCRNIMGAGYTQMGTARVGVYWTMVLARPAATD